MGVLMGDLTHVDFGGTEAVKSNHPAGTGVSPADRALLDVKKWSARLDLAREEYVRSVVDARSHGWSYSKIATAIGKTEGAVRLLLKRRMK